MSSDEDFEFTSSASTSFETQFTPFTPHLVLRDSKSQTSFSLLSSLLTTVGSLEIPHKAVEDDTTIKIGEGATYLVEKGYLYTSDRTLVAIKHTRFTVPKAGTQTYVEDPSLRRRIRSVLLELQILSHPSIKNHPNFVRLLGYSWEDIGIGYSPSLIVELAELGALNDFAASGLSWAEKKIVCDDIAVGLDVLHSCGIAHGDVKPDNVLVFRHHERRFIAKLSDFEHALLGTETMKYGGTPIYNAPEVQLQDHPSQKTVIPLQHFPLCDVFSFGLSVFEIFCDGKRYYRDENTRAFRDLLLSFDPAKDKILDLALDFLEKTSEFHPDMLRICKNIFQETLCSIPTDRLRGGWSRIREIIGAETFLFSAKKIPELSSEPPKQHQETEYSIISFFVNISLSSDSIQTEISAELRNRTRQSILPSEDRGKAAFQLCFCSAVGFGQSMSSHDSVNWLSQAALLGYEPAMIIGPRIMKANGLPVPDVFLYGSIAEETQCLISQLDSFAPEDYYSNAIRVFWGRELQELVQKTLDVDGDLHSVSEKARFLEWFNTKRISSNPETFGYFIDRNFLLHHSAAMGDVDISMLLVENGGNIDLVNNEGQTPLYLACRGGHTDVIKALLYSDADPSIGDTNSVTPLHWIVLFSPTDIEEISKLLVSSGADINIQMIKNSELHFDTLGLSLRGTPLHWACFCQNRVAVKQLLSLGANPTPYLAHSLLRAGAFNPLVSALVTLNANIAEILILTGKALDALSDDERAKLYREIGGALSHDFQRWIIHGEGYRQAFITCVDMLIRHGIPINGYPNVLEKPAANRMALFKMLRPSVKTKEVENYIPIHGAAIRLNVNLVKAMIARGAKVTRRDSRGQTALHLVLLAAFDTFRHARLIEMAKVFLEDSAALEEDTVSGSGRPASNLLMTACRFDIPLEMIRLLLSRGADATVNSLTEGQAAIHLCHEDPNVVGLLQEYGADINLESKHETAKGHAYQQIDIRPTQCCMTAAGKAATSENWEYLEALLDKGSTLIQGTRGGHQHTLLHLVVQRYYSRVVSKKYNPKIIKTSSEFFEKVLDHPVIKAVELINTPDWVGFTPLKYAIWFALPWCTELLLSRGAVVDSASPETTPRMLIDELYLTPPYFVENDIEPGWVPVDDFDSKFEWHRQRKSEYQARLKEVNRVLDARSQNVY